MNSRLTLNDAAFSVFAGQAMACADQGYRFALLLSLDESAAFDNVRVAYDNVKNVLDKIETREDALLFLAKFIYDDAVSAKTSGTGSGFGMPLLDKLSLKQRAAIGVIDLLGLTLEDAMEAISCEESDLIKALADARSVLMA